MPTPRSTPARPILTFTIGGEEVPFVIGYNAMCALEEEAGCSIFEIAKKMAEAPSMKQLRLIAMHGLSNAETVWSEAEAGDVIAEVGIAAVAGAFADELNAIVTGHNMLMEGIQKGLTEARKPKTRPASTPPVA